MLISKNDITNINEKIKEFENKYLIKLPSDYHLFLERYNGGKTPETEFKLNRRWTDIECFYGLTDENDIDSFYWMEKQWFYDEYLEDKMLIIANNMFGDYILLGIGEENYGMVYFRYHDRKKKYIKLTDSFKEFVDTCRSKEIGPIWTIYDRKLILYENGTSDKIDELTIECWEREIEFEKNIKQEEVIISNNKSNNIKIKCNEKDIMYDIENYQIIQLMNEFLNNKNNKVRIKCLIIIYENYLFHDDIKEKVYSFLMNEFDEIETFPAVVYLEIINKIIKKDNHLFRKIKMKKEIINKTKKY